MMMLNYELSIINQVSITVINVFSVEMLSQLISISVVSLSSVVKYVCPTVSYL